MFTMSCLRCLSATSYFGDRKWDSKESPEKDNQEALETRRWLRREQNLVAAVT